MSLNPRLEDAAIVRQAAELIKTVEFDYSCNALEEAVRMQPWETGEDQTEKQDCLLGEYAQLFGQWPFFSSRSNANWQKADEYHPAMRRADRVQALLSYADMLERGLL